MTGIVVGIGSGGAVGRGAATVVVVGNSVAITLAGSGAEVAAGGAVVVVTTRTACGVVLAIDVEAHAGNNKAAAAAARYPIRACIT